MNLLDNQSKAEEIDRMYMDLEDRLLQSIIEHLKDYEQPIDSDTWLMQKLAEIGKLNAQNIKLIKEQSGMTQEAINHMLLGAAEEAIDAIDPGLRKLAKKNLVENGVEASKSKNISQVMETILGQSKDLLNKTNTVMSYMAKDAYTKLVFDINLKAKEIANKLSFLKELGDEATAATIGIKSRQEAMISCIKKFSERGIPAFIDKAGREWTPEAYVNMNIRNTIKNTAEEVQTARCKDFGVNLISIDSHSGARPKCAKDQGKIFDLNNGSGEVEDARGRKVKYYPWNSSSYGEPDGILGINCKHHKHPFIPGVNIHRYFPTEDMDENNELYKQTQKQRQLEREVRKQKRECVLMKGLANAEEMDRAATKLKHKQNRLESYIENHKELYRRKDRERVVGYDKDISAKVNGINRRKRNEQDNINYMSNSFRPEFIKTKMLKLYEKEIGVKRVKNSKFDIVVDKTFSKRNKAIRTMEKLLTELSEKHPEISNTTIAILDFEKYNLNESAIGGYHDESGVLCINSRYDTREKILAYVNAQKGYFANKTERAPILHEIGHKVYYMKIRTLAEQHNIGYNDAKKLIDIAINEYIEKNVGENLISDLSLYAYKGYKKGAMTEIYAESYSSFETNNVAKNVIDAVERVISHDDSTFRKGN